MKRLIYLPTLILLTSLSAQAGSIWSVNNDSFQKTYYNADTDSCVQEYGYTNKPAQEKRVQSRTATCMLLKEASERVAKSGQCEAKIVSNTPISDAYASGTEIVEITANCECVTVVETSGTFADELFIDQDIYINPMSQCNE